jgi:hypothetical protein
MYHLLAHIKNDMIDQYIPYNLVFHDFIRVIIMQVSTHIFIYLSHTGVPFFSSHMFETTMFMIAGLCIYWFCIYVLFPIHPSQLKKKEDNNYNQSNSNIKNIDHDININQETNDNESVYEEDKSIISL